MTAASSSLIDRLALGYRAPGRSMEQVLAARPTEASLLILMLIAACVLFLGRAGSELYQAAAQISAEPGGDALDPAAMRQRLLALFVETVVVGVLAVYALGAGVRAIGRVFGGQGDWYDCRAACAWASLLIAAPVARGRTLEAAARQTGGEPGILQVSLFALAMALAIYALYLWSACVSRAHGARGPWMLFGALLGAAALLNLAAMIAR